MPAEAKILFVGLDRSSRSLVRMALLREDVIPFFARTLRKALSHVAKRSFDALVIDMDRFPPHPSSVLTHLSSRAREKLPPIVLLSSSVDRQQALQAAQMGVASWLLKPLAIPVLLERIRHAAGERSLAPDKES